MKRACPRSARCQWFSFVVIRSLLFRGVALRQGAPRRASKGSVAQRATSKLPALTLLCHGVEGPPSECGMGAHFEVRSSVSPLLQCGLCCSKRGPSSLLRPAERSMVFAVRVDVVHQGMVRRHRLCYDMALRSSVPSSRSGGSRSGPARPSTGAARCGMPPGGGHGTAAPVYYCRTALRTVEPPHTRSHPVSLAQRCK